MLSAMCRACARAREKRNARAWYAPSISLADRENSCRAVIEKKARRERVDEAQARITSRERLLATVCGELRQAESLLDAVSLGFRMRFFCSVVGSVRALMLFVVDTTRRANVLARSAVDCER